MKFIHLADVHLGAVPDKGSSWSHEREEEIWSTFRRVIASVRDDPVDLLFIAGDLFHRQPLKRELKEADRLFASIPDTNVYLIMGNHDYLKKDSPVRTYPWADNVILFDSETLMCYDDDRCPVTVYGFSFCQPEIRTPLLEGVSPEEGDGLHILLAHGGDESHVPIRFRELLDSGFDYIALGHIHKPQILKKDLAAYSGALEPLDRNDTGPHGYIRGWTENGKIRTAFVPVAVRSYEDIRISVTEESTRMEVEEAAEKEIREKGEKNIYRVILTGTRSPDLVLIPEKLKALGNVSTVQDETKMACDLEQLRRQYHGTLIGDYIDRFSGKELSQTEEKALYYGLQALLETSVN